jgi:hypothetical protein
MMLFFSAKVGAVNFVADFLKSINCLSTMTIIPGECEGFFAHLVTGH